MYSATHSSKGYSNNPYKTVINILNCSYHYPYYIVACWLNIAFELSQAPRLMNVSCIFARYNLLFSNWLKLSIYSMLSCALFIIMHSLITMVGQEIINSRR